MGTSASGEGLAERRGAPLRSERSQRRSNASPYLLRALPLALFALLACERGAESKGCGRVALAHDEISFTANEIRRADTGWELVGSVRAHVANDTARLVSAFVPAERVLAVAFAPHYCERDRLAPE